MVASPPPNRVGLSLDRRVRLRMGSPFGVRGLGERSLDPGGTELSHQYEGIDRTLEGALKASNPTAKNCGVICRLRRSFLCAKSVGVITVKRYEPFYYREDSDTVPQ